MTAVGGGGNPKLQPGTKEILLIFGYCGQFGTFSACLIENEVYFEKG